MEQERQCWRWLLGRLGACWCSVWRANLLKVVCPTLPPAGETQTAIKSSSNGLIDANVGILVRQDDAFPRTQLADLLDKELGD